MLDGQNFMKSGWIHSIKTHQFTAATTDNKNYVIMGEVFNEVLCLVLQYSLYMFKIGKAFTTTFCYTIIFLGQKVTCVLLVY